MQDIEGTHDVATLRLGSVQNGYGGYVNPLTPEQIARAEQQERSYREEREREEARQDAAMQRTQAQHLRTAALEAALRVTSNGQGGDVLTEAAKIAGFLIDG